MSEPEALLALDQGTTSSRALVFGRDGAVLGSGQQEFAQHFPKPGWVEHDPEDIWNSQLEAARQALATAGLEAAQVAAIGIANQRETALLWDAETGRPLATRSSGSAGARWGAANIAANRVRGFCSGEDRPPSRSVFQRHQVGVAPDPSH